MKKILAFGASNSKTSINKQLATYASSLLKNTEVEVLDLNDFDVPTYSVDLEGKSGIPDNAQQFLNKITASDGLIISLAEHNGAYTAIFKSLFDWTSRIDVKLFQQKPMLLMSTSPGARGGQSVLEIAENRFPIHDANIVAKFSLPSFNDNFKEEKIVDADLNTSLVKAVNTLAERL
ncbi:NADPH-dependent FMN reductase [Olleya marilimosa]|uniref:NAD(P)H-dependent oxidoreductase n=1 Tax=Olleya marilimosa TaxID=272164 RepID=A0ABR8LPH9_9FLAO|nr:NAD(P)H-dependent oxidoreductase [Olleya marilimosa]MBD3862123.1 NAD(P)H-dependent oxidoreductase [Olleya marilimosa]MBD3889618.1 NAD(P)H-dependent oxidoreductase [Olleya marilimosa]